MLNIPVTFSLHTCSICILISLRLNYGQISNKHRISRGGVFSDLSVNGMALIRWWRLAETRRLLEEIKYLIKGIQKVCFFWYFKNNLENTNSTTVSFTYQKTRVIFPRFNISAKAPAYRG